MTDIPIEIEEGEHGLFYGTSPAMKGLLVTGDSVEHVMSRVPQAIEDMRAAAAAMQRGDAYWTYDTDAGAWYFGLQPRAKPPFLKQRRVEAIIDIDAEGRLAGVEILEAIEPSRE
jgi:uncharacterized protein YuzE/predicted RNase H-like HicB family nuclease